MTRDEVYKGLEQADAYFRSSFDTMYGTAACEKFRSWVDAIEQALALLKAQEPQVMTISDFKDEGVYYLEALPPFVLRPVIYRLDYSDPRHYNFVWKYDQFSWNTDEYGKTWRCWTTRPSDEVRRTTPWEMK